MPDSHVSENRAWKEKCFLWGGEREDAIFSFPFKTYFFNKDFFENNEKRGDICDEKSQISPLKRQGKGSLLLPCPKLPIGIFFVKIHCRRIPEFRALREYSHALRLENASLRESLSDLRAANANRIRCAQRRAEPGSMKGCTSNNKAHGYAVRSLK